MEGTPPGRFGDPFASQPPRECGGDRAVGDAEGVERVRILRKDADAPLHAVGGGTGVEHQLLGRLAVLPREAGERRVLLVDPGTVAGHQRRQRTFGGTAIGELAERGHGKLDARHLLGSCHLYFGLGNPSGAEQTAGAVYELPVRGNAVTRRVLGSVGVVEICHALVGIVARHPTRIGARHERNRAPYLQRRLEGEPLVAGGVGCGGPSVHQEQRHGPRPRRNPARERRSAHRPSDQVEDQPVRARHRLLARIVRSGQRRRDRFFTGRTLPPRRRRSVAPDSRPAGRATRAAG